MKGVFVLSWRTVVIKTHAKISYKNGYMIVRGEDVKMVHLSEIGTVIVDSTQVSITSSLISEMIKYKIKVIFCDETRNPCGELMPYYGAYNSSKRVMMQVNWDKEYSRWVWTYIVKQKIINQSNVLRKYGYSTADMLQEYANNVEFFDESNREGHAAKVYFNSLFGKGFSRDEINGVNAALNYGYSIILSSFNKEIVSNGYLTQLGIKHVNEYNPFNLSCDMMEPFRVLVDEIVYNNLDKAFDADYKLMLVDVLNKRVEYCGKEYYLSNVIGMYLKKTCDSISQKNFIEGILYIFK